MNKFFLTVVPILLIIFFFNTSNNSREQKRQEQIELADAKSHPTNYIIKDIKNPSEHYIIIKVLLNDKDVRIKSSYTGLGRSICKINGDNKLLCDVIFTPEKFEDAFDTPDPDYSNEVFDYASATYNSGSGKTLFSCFYVENTLSSNCSTTMGNQLVVEHNNIPDFEYSSALLTKGVYGENIYTNKEGSNFNISYHEPKTNKMTDAVESLAMYSMPLTWWRSPSAIKASCIKGSEPVIWFDGAYTNNEQSDNQKFQQLNRVITYRLDKDKPKTISQSLDAYLITHRALLTQDVMLSPEEADSFINEVSKGSNLIIGKYLSSERAQAEIELQGLAASWNQLKIMCE